MVGCLNPKLATNKGSEQARRKIKRWEQSNDDGFVEWQLAYQDAPSVGDEQKEHEEERVFKTVENFPTNAHVTVGYTWRFIAEGSRKIHTFAYKPVLTAFAQQTNVDATKNQTDKLKAWPDDQQLVQTVVILGVK